MADVIQMQVMFTIEDPDTGVSYTDALYFDPDEYSRLKEADIEAMKQERFDNWKAAVAINPEEVNVSVEEQVQAVDEQIAALDEQRNALVDVKAALIEAAAAEDIVIQDDVKVDADVVPQIGK